METKLPSKVPADLREWRSWRTAANDRLLEISAALTELMTEVRELRYELGEERTGRPTPLLDTKGVAQFLCVSERKVYELVEMGEIVPVWIGGRKRFDQKMLNAYVRHRAGRRRPGGNGRPSWRN